MTQTASRIDVRTIAPCGRHTLIFSTFGNLAPGQALELVNDHDPRPLYDQFNAQIPGQFEWADLESGPETWRVAIRRLGSGHANGSCCGSCCGSCGGSCGGV